MFYKKKICLIGPALNLLNTNLGKTIDSFDIVCRINSSYIIKPELIKDYGSKCDVLLSTCNPTLCDAIKNNIQYLSNCKLIINPTKTYHTGETKTTEELVNKVTNQKIKFFQVPEIWYKTQIYKYKTLNTGLLSIIFLLEQNPKELFIAGFSFYNQIKIEDNYIFDHYNTYKNNPKNLPNTSKGKLLKGNKSSVLKKDCLDSCKNNFKKIIYNKKNVKLHTSIKNILGI